LLGGDLVEPEVRAVGELRLQRYLCRHEHVGVAVDGNDVVKPAEKCLDDHPIPVPISSSRLGARSATAASRMTATSRGIPGRYCR